MRFSTLAILFATTGLLAAGTAFGQYNGYARRPAVQRSNHAYGGYYQPPADHSSPSDAPAPPAAVNGHGNGHANGCAPSCEADEPSCEAEPDCGAEPTCEAEEEKCGNGCGCHCCDWCDLGEPWVLFDGCCLKKNCVVIKGWIDQGYTWNTDDPVDRFNGPQTFNDRSNEYQMNQFYLYIERAANTEECPLDWGYRVDFLYGTDWRTTPAIGMEIEPDGTRDWNQDHRFYGLAIPQFYGEVKINDLQIKAGRWYTPAGYEVVTATGNFFYSHAYTHQYFEPFTHTGLLGTWVMTDNLTVLGGVHEGWDQFEDINDDPSLIAGATWTSCDKKTSLAYVMTWGNEANEDIVPPATNTQNRYYQGIVFQRQVNDNLKYVAHSDYGFQEEVGGPGTPDAEWYSITQYLIYTVNDCLSYGFRYEAARDDDGFRIFGFGFAEAQAGVPSPMGFIGGGYPGTFQDITLGINYKHTANLLIRPEVRYDWYDGELSTSPRPLPFDTGTSDDQFTIGTDVIFTY